MPRTTSVTSDSEPDRVIARSTKKKYTSKKTRRASSDEEDVEEVEKEVEAEEETGAEGGEEDDDEEEPEEEYEIEKIIDAKKGQFPKGRMGYLVKWKNYGTEHNSWVDELDAGNAQELIDIFWAEKKKTKPGPRKSEPVSAKPRPSTDKAPRKSLAVESSIEPESHPKKRGRPKKEQSPDAMEVEEEEEEEKRTKKKPRKSNGRAKKQDSDEEEVFGSMKKHMNVASWEDLIESIDTVERESDKELYVFFTLKNEKKRVRESTRIAALKFPQKLIMFYESNLRWKAEDDPTDDAE